MGNDTKKGLSTPGAMLVGVAFGAVAVAAIAMRDRDNREKVGKKMSLLKKDMDKRVAHLMKQKDEIADKTEKAIDDFADVAKQEAREVKEAGKTDKVDFK